MDTFLVQNIATRKKAGWISFWVGVGMFFAKFTAYLITDSTAIFSDAAESVVHVVATSVALYSIYLSSKPADKTHLYGHGNVEYFSAGLEGILIIVAALAIFYTSIKAIVLGIVPEKLDIGTTIIAAAGIVNLLLGFYLVRTGKKTNSITLVADGKHVLTDSYTSIGVVIGLILVLITGYIILDPVIAIIIAANILFTGFKLIRESVGGLMNETDIELLDELSQKLIGIRKEYWVDIHNLRFWKSGDSLNVDFHLILPYYFSIKKSHDEEEFIETSLKELNPNSSARIHMDFCKDELCKLCDYQKCEFRKETRTIDVKWNSEKLLGKSVYELLK